MKIICEICGKEMESKEQSVSPGSSEPCLLIKPCCMPEDKAFDIENIVSGLDNINGGLFDLEDEVNNFMQLMEDGEDSNNFFHDSKLQRMRIKEFISGLIVDLRYIITEGEKI